MVADGGFGQGAYGGVGVTDEQYNAQKKPKIALESEITFGPFTVSEANEINRLNSDINAVKSTAVGAAIGALTGRFLGPEKGGAIGTGAGLFIGLSLNRKTPVIYPGDRVNIHTTYYEDIYRDSGFYYLQTIIVIRAAE